MNHASTSPSVKRTTNYALKLLNPRAKLNLLCFSVSCLWYFARDRKLLRFSYENLVCDKEHLYACHLIRMLGPQ